MPAVLTRPVLKPTPEQLLAAYTRCAKRTWPATYAAAMDDPLYSRLVHMNAVGQLLAQARTAKRAQLADAQLLPWPAGRAGQRQAARLRSPGAASTTPDRKRLAAGDTDDDE